MGTCCRAGADRSRREVPRAHAPRAATPAIAPARLSATLPPCEHREEVPPRLRPPPAEAPARAHATLLLLHQREAVGGQSAALLVDLHAVEPGRVLAEDAALRALRERRIAELLLQRRRDLQVPERVDQPLR